MPADYTNLNTELSGLETDLEGFTSVQESLQAFIDKQAALTVAAIEADNAIDSQATAAATTRINQVRDGMKSRLKTLADALVANTPNEGGDTGGSTGGDTGGTTGGGDTGTGGGETPSPRRR